MLSENRRIDCRVLDMITHFRTHSRTCVLCFGHVDDGWLVQEDDLERLPPNSSCSNTACKKCKGAPLTFLAHDLCVGILQILRGAQPCEVRSNPTAIEDLWTKIWDMGKALAPIAPGPSVIWSQTEVLQSSFCPATILRILRAWPRHDNVWELLGRLCDLPQEILQIIISDVKEDCALRTLFILFGDTFKLLANLEFDQDWNSSVSSEDEIFATSIRIGSTTYLTGLFDEEVEDSVLLKPATVRGGFLVVWLNTIGITRVEFHSSLDSLPDWKSDREWLYAMALPRRIQIHSKGVFLKEIADSAAGLNSIHWNSSKALLYPGPQLPRLLRNYKTYLHYVPIHDTTTGISFAFRTTQLLAIISHGGATDRAEDYSKADEDAAWIYCPLRKPDENIVELWSVQSDSAGVGNIAFILRTDKKLLWIGVAYENHPQAKEEAIMEPLSRRPPRGLYYNVRDQIGARQVVGATSEGVGQGGGLPIARPDFPARRTQGQVEPISAWTEEWQWFYSGAPLSSVERVRTCSWNDDCQGVLLRYNDHDEILGQYRLDWPESEWIDNPQWVVVRTYAWVQVRFSQYHPTDVDVAQGDRVFPMSGFMCWWFRIGQNPRITVVSE